MDSPASYHKANQLQRRDSLEIIEEYFPKFKWRSDYQDSLIDIGSGPGDVLFDFVYPKMPRDFRRIVCSDLNPNMVEYAKSIYGHLEKIEFTTLNIESKNELAKDLKGQFDHLTSFNVLHWTKDLRQSFHNIYDLLRPHDGDCLLLFTIDFGGLYDILNRLRMAFKWSKYLNNLGCITAPLHHSRNPKNDLFIILNDVGFSEYEIHITNKVFDYDNEAIFQKNMNAVNPFLKFIPAGSHQQFSRAFVDTAISLGFKNTTNERIRFHYKAVVIYARK